MKYNFLKIPFVLSLVLLPLQLKAADAKELFDNDEVIDQISPSNKPLVFTDEAYKDLDGTTQNVSGNDIRFQYLSNRRTLTGRDCAINKIVNTVDVGSGQKNLQNVLNDDLNDYGEFISTASVGVGYNPLLSIKDNSCYYAKGSTAGFCIVANSGNTVLSLDVIKVMSISFYRDGKLIQTKDVREGQDAGGINLKLVNIPGSDEASTYLTAVAPCVFDEISLDFAGGVNVGVGQLYRIKYAFVGDAREFTITESNINGSVVSSNNNPTPFQQYEEENSYVNLDYVKGWNPVLLGLPFPISSSEMKNFTNANLDDYISLTPIVGLIYMGGAKFMMKDTNNSKREVYKPGTEVGFFYTHGSGLDLDLGNTIEIILFDRNGNKVESKVIGSGVLGLSVANGGKGSSSITSTVPFSGAEIRFYGALKVSLGALGIHYAFVREQPEIRHNCPINPSADIYLCSQQSSYQLLSNPEIPVKWTFEEFIPANEEEGTATTVKVTEGGYVSSLDKSGKYIFRATAADGCSDSIALFWDMFPSEDEVFTQGDPLVNDYGDQEDGDAPEYVLSEYDSSSGGLLIIDQIENPGNVLDGKYDEATQESGLDKYAKWGGMELASNQMILGIKRTNGNIIDYDRDHDKPNYENGTRVGFVVSSSVTGLNLSILNFWTIRCFKDGVEVYRKVIDESRAVSAALAGSDGDAKRTRYAITVPWYDKNENRMKVDEIQLWSSGVLNLKGEELDIYYPFVEGEAEDGGNPLNCSATVISTETTGATIDYSLFGNASLIQALGVIDNISYIIDNDPKMATSLTESHTASVAARVTIPVYLGRTVDFRNTIGVVMRDDAMAADVKLGSGMTIYTMYNGQPTGDSFSNWGVLGADVAGYGDKQIYYIQPTRICDEIVIDYGNGLTVASSPRFFGLFLLTDSDADGVPDCQDRCSCAENISDINPGSVCAGATLEITATGIPGTSYKVKFNDPAAIQQIGQGSDIYELTATQETKNNIEIKYTTDKPGQYQMTFYNEEGTPLCSAVYYVHPVTTTWRTNAASSDWTNWSNWSEGTPYCCTNVIIPSNAKNYPILSRGNDIEDEFCCNNIFIRPGAYIGTVNQLNYKRAWVQMELSANCYNLLTAPLKEMVTGDMFIPADKKGVDEPNENELFDYAKPEENRFNPTIYQRLWFSSAKEKTPDALTDLTELQDIEEMNFTKWSKNFNHLNTPYTSGMGFSMWVDNGKLSEDTKFRFTFPKENDKYKYFDDFTQEEVKPVVEESINRGDNVGRFIYESDQAAKTWEYKNNESTETRSLYNVPENVKITAQASTDHFLFGNPFMSPINAREFIKENSDVIKGIKYYDGNTTSSLVYDNDKNEFVSTGNIDVIAPMTAVFVIAKDEAASTEMTVNLEEEMIDPDYVFTDDSEQARGIRVMASSGELCSSMVALTESDFQNYALFDNEVSPRLAIFSTKDGEAFDIVSDMEDVPLTIIAVENKEITLEFFTYGVDRDEWQLIDYETGTEYPLDHEIILPAGTGTTSGRFHLKKLHNVSTGIEEVEEVQAKVFLTVIDNNIVAKSIADNLILMEVFDLSGKNVAIAQDSQSILSAEVSQGIYVVRVTSDSGVTTHKILVR